MGIIGFGNDKTPGIQLRPFIDEIDRSPWDEAAAEDEGIARLL